MSKALVNKVRLILVLALVMVVSVCAGMFAFAKADVTISSVDEVTTFQLNETGIFYHEEDDKVGLNFTASISVAEYEALQTLDGFGYGIVIAPDYYPDLNQANLFDDGAIFGWATYENNEWLAYEGEGYQVINIYTNDWKLGDGVYTYSGAIVDILPQNIGADFKAVAYITADGLYNITDEIVTSTTIEYAKCGAEVPSYVPAEWAFEPEVLDLGIVTPADMGDEINFYEAPSGREYKLVDNNGYEVTEGIIDLTLAENQRQWTMTESINGVTLSVMTFDVVSEMPGFLWNDEVSIASVDAINIRKDGEEWNVYDFDQNETSGVTEETIDDVDYISYTKSGDNGTWFSWKPLHSKEYYEGFVGKGISLTATLMVDVTNMGTSDVHVLNQQSIFAIAGPVNVAENMSTTKAVSLDDVVANWDAFVGCSWDHAWGSRMNNGMIYVYNVHNGGKISVSFGTEIDVSAFAMNGGDILVNLDEVADLSAVDMTSYMSEDHLTELNGLAAMGATFTYEAKGYSITDTITVTDPTAVDLSAAKHGAYIVNIKSGDAVVYTAVFDIYSESDEVVWAESLTKENVVLRRTSEFLVGAYYTESVEASFISADDFEIVDSITIGDKTYEGSFIKYSATEDMNLSVDIKALHTKAYYNEMIGDSANILHLRGYFSAGSTMQIMCGMNNYGMNNKYIVKGRQGFSGGKLESFVLSLDNALIANSADETYHGYFYDWNNINSTNVGMCRPMITFEVAEGLVAGGSWDMYFGIYDDQITEGGESLASDYAVKTIDLSTATSYDLINLLPANQHAKFKGMAKAWAGKNGKHFVGNAIGFKLTIGGQTHCVVPNAEGAAILNLDDYIVASDGTVSETVTVRSLLAEGNNSVGIVTYAPPVVSMGHASWPVTAAPSANITIVGPAAAVVE